MPRNRDLLTGTLAAIVAASLFATLGPLSRFAADAGMDGVAFTAWRAGLGVAALGVLIALRGALGDSWTAITALERDHRLALALVAVIGVVLNVAMFTSFGLIPIALALMLFYTYPAGVAVVDVLLGREPVTRSRTVALALAFTGVVLVLAGSPASAIGGGPNLPGILLALVAAACQVVFVTVSRTGYRSVPAPAATLVILTGSTVGGALVALVVGQGPGLAAPLRSAEPWPILLFAGVAAAGISSLLFLTAIRRIGGTRTGILMLLEPVVGVLLAALWLREPLAPIQALGGVLVLAGALVLQVAAPPELEPVVEEAAGPVI